MKRVFGALLLIVILAAPAILGPPLALYIVALIVLPACLYELYRVGIEKEAWLLGWIGMVGSFPYLYTIYMGWFTAAFFTLCATTLLMMAAALFLFEKGKASALQLSIAIAGLVYPLALTSFWIVLRNGVDGRFWMIFGVICTFGADTGAFLAGKTFGKHPLAPRLSPKKTVEGLAGGVAASILGGVIFFLGYTHFLPLDSTRPLWFVLALSFCISFLDLMGDLTASMYKRQFQVKDMGNLIPGHGGMLDRMDGIIPVGILLYFALQVAV
jgi:phosphatidate cytidylyltransferase